MKIAALRAVLLTLCALAACIAIAEFIGAIGAGGMPPWLGIWGDTVAASSQPYHLVVRSIDPGGAADRAGLRVGDLIDLRASTLVERFSLLGQPLGGRPVPLVIRRGATEEVRTVVPSSVDLGRRWDAFLVWPGTVWIALFASLIAWRRSHVRETRMLCLVLVTYAFWGVTSAYAFAAPWAWVYLLLGACNVLGPLSIAFWARCTGYFGAPASQIRRVVAWFCYALVAVSIVLGAARISGIVWLPVDRVGLFSVASGLPANFAFLAAFVCVALAILASRHVERQKASWLLVPPAFLFVSRFALDAGTLYLSSYAGIVFLSYLDSCIVFVTPLVLAYVALTRRLIDIGFVLNRAAVFAIVSTIVIGIFILVEWAASEWLGGGGRASGGLATMLAALALGFSLRYIHRCVDRFVDWAFFRKRRKSETSLKRRAYELSNGSDRATLVEQTLLAVRQHTKCSSATILLLARDGTFVANADASQSVSVAPASDPALVALRTWHKPIDLEPFAHSALQGQVAFPMVSRGTLVGVLVCGAQQDSDALSPSESDALLELCDVAGTALGFPGVDCDATVAQLEEELRRAQVAAVREREVLLREIAELRREVSPERRAGGATRP